MLFRSIENLPKLSCALKINMSSYASSYISFGSREYKIITSLVNRSVTASNSRFRNALDTEF